MADVFISYAREDRTIAERLAGALESEQLTVWWDISIVAGKSFDRAIETELESAGSVIVLWSRKSRDSEWVKSEASVAAERGVLVPAIIEDVRPPLEFRRKQTADLKDWTGSKEHAGFKALLQAARLNAGIGPPAVMPSPASSAIRPRVKWWLLAATSSTLIVTVGFSTYFKRPPSPPAAAAKPVAASPVVFTHPGGSFRKQGEYWVEYPPFAPGQYITFKEAQTDGDYLYVYDKSRHADGDPLRIMYLRFPLKGGMSQWSFANPFVWQDLYVVTPQSNAVP